MPDRTADADWWTMPIVGRIFVLAILWLMLVVGIVFFVGSFYMLAVPEERDWNQIAGGFIYLPLIWLMGRSWVVGIAVKDDAILVRRGFLGRAERIPLSNIRSCRVKRSWISTALVIWIGGPLPLMLSRNGWFWLPPWDTLISAVRERLDPLGKWRD